MQISQETTAEMLKLGSLYALPIAVLLRALYSGMRGNMPEGIGQIALVSIFAGIASIIDPNQPFDWRRTAAELVGNTVFMAGLLSFIVVYLIRQPFRGPFFDGIVGAVAGLIAWFIWTVVLQNNWSWWTAPLATIAGAALFIALRFSLRQIARLVRIATYFIILGIVLIIGAGGVMAFNWISTQLT